MPTLPLNRPAADRADGMVTVALESTALVLTTLGAIHLMLLCLFDFNLISEAFGARPVTAEVVQVLMMVSAIYSAWIVHRQHRPAP